MRRRFLIRLIRYKNELASGQQPNRIIDLMTFGAVLGQDGEPFEDFLLDVEPELWIGV